MSSIEAQFIDNPKIREKYSGKWVAVFGSKVIAYGDDIAAVHKSALELSGGQTPLFEYIPLPQEHTLIL